MDTLMVDSGTVGALALQLFFVVAMPIWLLVRWYKRHDISLFPAVAGLLVYLVFTQLLEQVLHYAFLFSDNLISRRILGQPWLFALYLGLATALCEQTGYYMAFKYLLRRTPQRENAITFGIGHGGYECLAVAGLTSFSYLVLAIFLQKGMAQELLAMFPSYEAAMLESLLAQVAEITPFVVFWGIVERAVALALHISLSVIVFAAVRQPETRGSAYLAAIGLRTLSVIPVGLYQAGLLTGNRGMVAVQLLVLVVTLISAWWARRIWRELPPLAPDVIGVMDRDNDDDGNPPEA